MIQWRPNVFLIRPEYECIIYIPKPHSWLLWCKSECHLTYTLANTGDNGDLIATPSSCGYVRSHPEVGYSHTENQHLHQIIYWDMCILLARNLQPTYPVILLVSHQWVSSSRDLLHLDSALGWNEWKHYWFFHEMDRVLDIWWGLTH